MRTFRMMIVAGMLLAAIACSKDEETAPAGSVTSVQSSSSEEVPVKGSYLIKRFEQDGVENPELREQRITFDKDHKVKVNGRNYELVGTWNYDSAKGYLDINVPGNQVQAIAVTAATWEVISSNAEETVLQANLGQTTKKLELQADRAVAKLDR